MSAHSKDMALFKAFLEKLQSVSADTDFAADVNEVNQWSEPTPLVLEALAAILRYSATDTGKEAANARQEVLRSAFQTVSYPSTVPIKSKALWGAASSAQRLFAISRFLVWMCDYPYAKKVVARRQIAQDLVWLKAQFFHDSMRFEWPQITLAPVVRRQSSNAAFLKSLVPSKDLVVVVGTEPLPRTEAMSKLWAYIKRNGLQSIQNKRMIHTDENLRKIFGKTEVTMFELAGLIGRHLS